jgi:ABC-type glycerol-3-phosphate transport system permease component
MAKKHRKKHNDSPGERIFSVFNYIFVGLIMFLCTYPFYYIIIFSLSDPTRAVLEGVYFWPAGFDLSSYATIFRTNDIITAFFISFARTIIGAGITVFSCSFLAFLLTKKKMWFRKTIYRMLIATMYFNAGLIPWYLVMRAYGLMNNFFVYIIPGAISAFYVILIKTYMEQVVQELEEAAMVDGAGYFTTFLKIVFPVSLPIVAVIAVYASVGQWNSWVDNFFLVTDGRLQTLQMLLLNYLNEADRIRRMAMTNPGGVAGIARRLSPESIRASITVIVTLPILFAYPFLQRFFVKGIMVGEIKG